MGIRTKLIAAIRASGLLLTALYKRRVCTLAICKAYYREYPQQHDQAQQQAE